MQRLRRIGQVDALDVVAGDERQALHFHRHPADAIDMRLGVECANQLEPRLAERALPVAQADAELLLELAQHLALVVLALLEDAGELRTDGLCGPRHHPAVDNPTFAVVSKLRGRGGCRLPDALVVPHPPRELIGLELLGERAERFELVDFLDVHFAGLTSRKSTSSKRSARSPKSSRPISSRGGCGTTRASGSRQPPRPRSLDTTANAGLSTAG